MSRRRSSGMKFGVPLATAESQRVFRCYAFHGKAYGRAVPKEWPYPVRLLCVNSSRETRWEDGVYEDLHHWRCPALFGDHSWRRFGWLPADGSLPFGDLDAVDPDLAQFDYLPAANSAPPSLTPHNWM